MKKVLSLILFLFPTCSVAGDYMLYVANKGNSNECAKSTHWTVKTSEEVSNSFTQYFSGKRPDIGILRAVFANGHFRFCGSNEVNEVLATLHEIKKRKSLVNKQHITDFIRKIEAVQ